MNLGLKQRNAKLLVIVILLVAVALGAGYAIRGNQNTYNNAPANSTAEPAAVTPAESSAPSNRQNIFPGGSTPPTSLEDCLNRVNNSDAPQSVIESFTAQCHQQYR